MSKPLSLQQRVENLERMNRELLALVQQGIGRRGRIGYPVQTRLVQTTMVPGESPGDPETYPADGANVFPGKFVDTKFDPTEGEQTVTHATRSETPQVRFLQLDDEFLPPGAVVPAFQLAPLAGGDGGRWYSNVFATKVRFRNESGYSAPAYGCMRLTGYDTDEQAYTVARPDAAYFDSQYLINGNGTVADAGYGWGRFLGLTGLTIACDSGTPAAGECWGPQPDSFLLRKHADGFLVSRAAGSGKLRAFPYPILEGIGKCGSAISVGSTGSVDIYYGTSGSEADSGFNLTARAKWAAISASKWVSVARRNGQWYVTPLEC